MAAAGAAVPASSSPRGPRRDRFLNVGARLSVVIHPDRVPFVSAPLPSIVIRPAGVEDSPGMVEIYNQGIRGRQATFETRERTPADIASWFGDPRHPVLVAVDGERVLGWVASSTYRPRDCYAGIAEFSVYVHQDARRRGVGDRLMAAFLPACEAAGCWKVLSRIFPENTGSRGLCARHGFREVGTYQRHGKLDGAWRDVVIVERLLGAAAE